MIDPVEVAAWTRGWAICRDRPPPAPAFGGWFVHVDQPDQVARYVFDRLDIARLRALGAAIREPHVLLKHPEPADSVQYALGGDWDAVRTGWLMRGSLRGTPRAMPDGFAIEQSDGAYCQYRVHGRDGAEAARARLIVRGAHAVIDSVDTEPPFRRMGIASALTGRLSADALAAGATTGLLVATDAGLRVYERLGWHVLAPWTTAQRKRTA